jgi:hypothetical protein
LVSIGQIDQARTWFSRAYSEDVRVAGLETAAKLPAFKNLALMNKIGAQAKVIPKEQAPSSPAATPQAVLGVSKSELRHSIVTHFLIGGILAGLILTLLSGAAQYFEVTYLIPLWTSLLEVGVVGIVIILFVVVVIYKRAPEM